MTIAKLRTNCADKTIDQTNSILIRIKGTYGTSGIGIIGNTNFVWIGTVAADAITAGNLWHTAPGQGGRNWCG